LLCAQDLRAHFVILRFGIERGVRGGGTRQRKWPACRRSFLWLTAAVILLGWYPWNVLLLALLQLTKGREVSAGYGFVYEVQFVGEVMIAGFGILFFAGHRALLVAVNEWRSDFVLQKDERNSMPPRDDAVV
jgi:hypothetical protein